MFAVSKQKLSRFVFLLQLQLFSAQKPNNKSIHVLATNTKLFIKGVGVCDQHMQLKHRNTERVKL